MYNKKDRAVRTSRVNSIFAQIPIQARVLEEKENGDSVKNRHKSDHVPRTGIEPALPCDNQILSLARLPIPPSGQSLMQVLSIYHTLCVISGMQIY